MGVNLIFKIAAVGILVSVICQVLKHSGREEPVSYTHLKERRVVLRLSAKGIPVYEMEQEIPAGERPDEMRMWRRLTQSLARDWELPREGAERLLNADFYF